VLYLFYLFILNEQPFEVLIKYSLRGKKVFVVFDPKIDSSIEYISVFRQFLRVWMAANLKV